MASDGNELMTRLNHGLVQHAQGNRSAAIALWREVLETDPADERALDYLQSVGALPPAGEGEMDADFLDDVGGASGSVDTLEPPFSASDRIESPETVGLSTDELPAMKESIRSDVEVLMSEAVAYDEQSKLEEAFSKIEEVLKKEPDNLQAVEHAESLKERLAVQFMAELEPLTQVPALKVTDASILELSLDTIGGFLISQIDGAITLEELLSILGAFDRFRVLQALHFFLKNDIVELHS